MTTKEYVEHYRIGGYESQCKEYNRNLCARYPWLIPTNPWSGKKITDCCGADGEEGFWPDTPDEHPEYDYDSTELDEMPDGWRIAFGDEMCEEIHRDLVENDYVDKFIILQIKEKYGSLRFYCGCIPVGSKIYDIIHKYEHMSERICVVCGKPAKYMTTGWICPYCENCVKELKYDKAVPIDGENNDEIKN